MGDFQIATVQISGATLASLLQRCSAAAGDIHGFLFGHVIPSIPYPISDHPTTSNLLLTVTITSFLSLPSLLPLSPPPPSTSSAALLGFFSARRRARVCPSLKDSTTALSLSSASLTFIPHNSTISLPPSIFLLFSTPFQRQLVDTYEYKVFQFKGNSFEPKSLNINNIGQFFRSQYDSFSPSMQFPVMDSELRGSNATVDDEEHESLANRKRHLQDQKQMDTCAEGFETGRLDKIVDSEAAYRAELEDFYDKMLTKIDGLSRLVEQTNAEVLEQENHNMKLRFRFAGVD